MWHILLRITVGILLFIHGMAHWQIITGWGSQSNVQSWLLPQMAASNLQSLGNFLWVATLLTFVLAAILLFFSVEWWRAVAVVASVLSLVVIVLFWQPNMVLGVAVDVGILVALLWAKWPTPVLLGA